MHKIPYLKGRSLPLGLPFDGFRCCSWAGMDARERVVGDAHLEIQKIQGFKVGHRYTAIWPGFFTLTYTNVSQGKFRGN
jgi:hypothetical protein